METKYKINIHVLVSLITNGSLMGEEWVKNCAGMFETIGFSVDSINDETNRKIGRCDRNEKTIPAGRIVELCRLIRKYAPGYRIKINTVVSALNKNEMMSDFIDEISTDRWKILRMKPFQYDSFSNLDIQVSNEEFEEFVERNRDRKGKEDGVTAEAGMGTARREIVVEPDMKASSAQWAL